MKTCHSCIYWLKLGQSHAPRRVVYDNRVVTIAPGDEGQCRAQPPATDNRWPLTMGGDWCGCHADKSKFSTLDAGKPGDVPPEDKTPSGSGKPTPPTSGKAK